jgi:predicted transcriptional regulator
MASKTREITIKEEGNAFNVFFKKMGNEKKAFDFEGLSALRKLLSNEKARLLHVIKSKSPNSIYGLAKILGRDFKSVSDDVKLLERFGFIDLISEKSGDRERLKPVIVVDEIKISVKL